MVYYSLCYEQIVVVGYGYILYLLRTRAYLKFELCKM